jgi:hypothetical protein
MVEQSKGSCNVLWVVVQQGKGHDSEADPDYLHRKRNRQPLPPPWS